MDIETILTRRSVREYKEEEVSPEIEEHLLQAAMAAPSAGNQQPWEFVIVDKPELKTELAAVHPYAKMVENAPLVIVVCGNHLNGFFPEFWVQDCSAATQNILIAAHSMGLGAVWTGIHPEENRVTRIREILNVPAYLTPFAMIPLGYPAEKKEAPQRFNPEKIHRNELW